MVNKSLYNSPIVMNRTIIAQKRVDTPHQRQKLTGRKSGGDKSIREWKVQRFRNEMTDVNKRTFNIYSTKEICLLSLKLYSCQITSKCEVEILDLSIMLMKFESL